MIRRGTTPTFKLYLQSETVDLTQADNVYATFQQGNVVITKTGADLDVDETEVDVYLDQSETLRFYKGFIDVQLNWTYADGSRACSNIIKVDIGENLVPRVLPEVTP